jgi:hypothetical protein
MATEPLGGSEPSTVTIRRHQETFDGVAARRHQPGRSVEIFGEHMGRRRRSLRQVARDYALAAVGGSTFLATSFAFFERMYGMNVDYWYAPIFGIGLPSSVLLLDSMRNLGDELSRGRRRPTTVQSVSQWHGRDGIPVLSSGRQVGSIFTNTFSSIFGSETEAGHSGVASSRKRWQSDLSRKETFVVFINRRDRPVMIEEDFLLHFLRLAWERQNDRDRSVNERVFSRPYFTSEISFCSHSTYYALMELCAPAVWGREQGASGYLCARPEWAIKSIRAAYLGQIH